MTQQILIWWRLLTEGKTIFTWQVSVKICWISLTWDVKQLSGVFTRVLWGNGQLTYLIVHTYTKQELIFVDWVAKNEWCSPISRQGWMCFHCFPLQAPPPVSLLNWDHFSWDEGLPLRKQRSNVVEQTPSRLRVADTFCLLNLPVGAWQRDLWGK